MISVPLAIGIGKRTLGDPRQSAAPQRQQQGCRGPHGPNGGVAEASMRPRRRSGQRGSG